MPRGEVGLVAAGIGSGIGAVSGEMFVVVVFMSIATTVLAPPALVQRCARRRVGDHREPAVDLTEP